MAQPRMTRQAAERFRKIKAWLVMRGLTHRELARLIGVHPSMITRILKGERAPAARIASLVELGVPEHLLPPPNTRGPGRPPRSLS